MYPLKGSRSGISTISPCAQIREQSIYCVHIAVEMAPIAKVSAGLSCGRRLLSAG